MANVKIGNKDYVDIKEYLNPKFPYQAFLGGRGSGKTFSAFNLLLSIWNETKRKGIWMRRTETEMELLGDSRTRGEGLNPFKSYNTNKGTNYGLVPMNKKVWLIQERTFDEKGSMTVEGVPIGYGLALSSVATIRGIDLSDCDILIFDEFIKEQHVKTMSGEADAFFNAIETISRNRELEGKAPLLVFLLSNSTDINTPIFGALNIVNHVERMARKGQQHCYFDDKGLGVHLLEASSNFVTQKSQTSLYKLTNGSRFHRMSLGNEFAYNDFSLVQWRNTKGLKPICQVDDWFIFSGSFTYVTYMAGQKVHKYHASRLQEAKEFRFKYGAWLLDQFISSKIFFETYELKEKFIDIMKIK